MVIKVLTTPDNLVKSNREQGTDFILPKWAFSRRQETSVSCSHAERSPFYLEVNMDNKTYYQNNPWMKHLCKMRSRCRDKTDKYCIRGIKCFVTPEEIKYLWFRDKAYLLEKSSIDRIDNNGNYTLNNCRFIEWKLNSGLGGKIGGLKGKGKKRTDKTRLQMSISAELRHRKLDPLCEQGLRKCKQCGKILELSKFEKRGWRRKKQEYRHKCKECNKLHQVKE